MTIEELTNKANMVKNQFTESIELYSIAYDALINQLIILARENNGILPDEFLLSDNKELLLTFDNISRIFKYLDLKVDSICNNLPIHIRMDGNIPRTIYTDKYYKLYHVKLISK